MTIFERVKELDRLYLLCPGCHGCHHDGHEPRRHTLIRIVAEREGRTWESVEEEIKRLAREKKR